MESEDSEKMDEDSKILEWLRENNKILRAQMSDIEASLGTKRKHLIAIAFLVGNDHDLKGVQGIGLESALSFVKPFNKDEVLDRLFESGSGSKHIMTYVGDSAHNTDKNITRTKVSHCSLCGHPGSKRSHFKNSCERCSSSTDEGCIQKPVGYRCDCSSCDQELLELFGIPVLKESGEAEGLCTQLNRDGRVDACITY